MKIHKYISLSIMMLSMLTACEPSHLNDNLLDSKVSFSRGGINSVLFYDVEGTFTHSFYAVNPGYFEGETKVTITKSTEILNKYNEDNETALKELPADCYTILNAEGQITKDGRACKFDIRFDCDKLRDLSQVEDYSDLADYIVPFLLTTDGGIDVNEDLSTVLFHPDMRRILVSILEPGDTIVQKKDIKGTLEYKIFIKPATDNNWESIFDVTSGDAAIQYINESLIKRASLSAYSALTPMPSEAYTIDFTNVINLGTHVATMTVKVDASKIPEGCFSIACYLNGATIAGEDVPIEGKPYRIINFQNVDPISTVGKVPVDKNNDDESYLGKYLTDFGYTALSRSGWVFSPESYHNNSYSNAIDGNTGSNWENRYNDNANSAGPKSTLPFNAILDLGSVQDFTAIEIWRRMHATYVKDLRGYEIYVSDDKENWKYVTTIDYGTEAEQRAMYNIFQKVSGRYINLYITRSNRSANVSFAEIFIWNK
ncbi:hypothetical protein GGR21_003788 [Dysgonomonas hofstadii]|uniref:F5/8 type C domain-containing protein n=1 Tax=Dysgonomonas hofstadii TaxID=637886 RepID=A0A840CP42_9BACT|nr:discoidin domain-containing protein [Dysgonomonas hofstadii]MBB4037867.1 hypothetical protein [Dysgonomonas hofstadii]